MSRERAKKYHCILSVEERHKSVVFFSAFFGLLWSRACYKMLAQLYISASKKRIPPQNARDACVFDKHFILICAQ